MNGPRIASIGVLLAAVFTTTGVVFAGARARPTTPAGNGRALVESGECVRCHVVPQVATAPRAKSCAGCHAWIAQSRHDIVERERGREDFPKWDRYVERVDSFLAVPDLAASGARLDPDWVASYLRAPYKVRPDMPEEMIRTRLSEKDARAAAVWLASLRPKLTEKATSAAKIEPLRTPAALQAGERLYAEYGCAMCHVFGERAANPGHRAAPDLAHARDRMRPEIVAAFIADPAAFGPSVGMPDFALSPEQSASLRDFVVFSPLAAARPKPIVAELPLLARNVSWKEVNEEVFGVICVHCHMNAAENSGDGGPGNTGGIGWKGTGLDMSSFAGLFAGALENGNRVSVLEVPRGGEARLITRLRTRYVEDAAERTGRHAVAPSSAVPGMPLGLGPLSPTQFQLIRTWVAQGAPGPVENAEEEDDYDEAP